MKQRWTALCLGLALLAGLGGCGAGTASIEDYQWTMTLALNSATGQVVACGPQEQQAHPEAEAVAVTCRARAGEISLQAGEDSLRGAYEPTGEQGVYRLSLGEEGAPGQGVCSFTKAQGDRPVPTLVLSLPRGYTLYFSGGEG